VTGPDDGREPNRNIDAQLPIAAALKDATVRR
jgi:hypothetical protein